MPSPTQNPVRPRETGTGGPKEHGSSANYFTCIFMRSGNLRRNSFGHMMQRTSCCLQPDGSARAITLASAQVCILRSPPPRLSPAVHINRVCSPRFLRLQTIAESVNLAPRLPVSGWCPPFGVKCGWVWLHVSSKGKSDATSRSGAPYHAPLRHASAGVGPGSGQRTP